MGFEIENGVLKKYVAEKGVTDVVIPDGVTEIGGFAFNFCTCLKSVTIPDGVTKIGKWAFDRCTSLTSIIIPNSVTKIGDWAFTSCKSLTNITIPDSVTEICENAFCACTSLTSITIPNSVTGIGWEAFRGCTSLQNITIPNGMTRIESRTFSDCTSLSSITMPDSVTKIERGAFKNCTNLNEIIAYKLPISEIEEPKLKIAMAMRYLNNREKFTDKRIVDEIEAYIFRQASRIIPILLSEDNITGISFFGEREKITKENIDKKYLNPAIEANATQCVAYLLDWKNNNVTAEDEMKKFQRELNKNKKPYNVADMKKLWSYGKNDDGTLIIKNYKGSQSNVEVPPMIGKTAVTQIGNELFKDCTSLTNITIPNSVTQIGARAFYGCTSLTSVTIFDGVTTIECYAFYGCTHLTSVTIPNSVTEIGSGVFYGCTSLTSITIPDSVTLIDTNAFSNCTSLTSITIPNSVTEIDESAFERAKKKLTIHTVENSCAHQYAMQEGIRFELI